MGQAKKRGTFKQRKVAAISRRNKAFMQRLYNKHPKLNHPIGEMICELGSFDLSCYPIHEAESERHGLMRVLWPYMMLGMGSGWRI